MNAGRDVVLKYCKIAIMIVAVIFVALTLVPFYEVKSILNGLSPDNNSSILTPSTIVVFRAFFIVTALILLAYVHGEKGWAKLYALLLASLYGVICSAQILGIFGAYRLVLVLPLTVGIVLFLFVLYEKYWSTGFYDSVFHRSANTKDRFLDYGFWTVGTILLLFLILAPLVLWPFSQVNRTLAWDVGIYHFPKALELANTGSAWDLTISYGEYPFGYESLFAFAALFNRSGMLFGSMHAIGVLFFMLTFWLLLCRYTILPVGFNFLIIVCLLISGLFWRDKLYNIWWIYRIV